MCHPVGALCTVESVAAVLCVPLFSLDSCFLGGLSMGNADLRSFQSFIYIL